MDPQTLSAAMRGMSPQQAQQATGMVANFLLQDRKHQQDIALQEHQQEFMAAQNEMNRMLDAAKLDLEQAKGDAYIQAQTSGAALDRQRLTDLKFQHRLLDRAQHMEVETNVGPMSLLLAQAMRQSGLNITILGDESDLWDRELVEFLGPDGTIDRKLVSINKSTGDMDISESIGKGVPSGSVNYFWDDDAQQMVSVSPGQTPPAGRLTTPPRINLEGEYDVKARSEDQTLGTLRAQTAGPDWAGKIKANLSFWDKHDLDSAPVGSEPYEKAAYVARETARSTLQDLWRDRGQRVDVVFAEDDSGRTGFYAVYVDEQGNPTGKYEFIRGDVLHD